jgi:hypothetical protein
MQTDSMAQLGSLKGLGCAGYPTVFALLNYPLFSISVRLPELTSKQGHEEDYSE